MPELIYLDEAATTPLLSAVQQKMCAVLELQSQGLLGNAASLHAPGQRAKQLIEEARTNIARLINAEPEEIIFTSGGSESNNTVINTFAGQKIAVSSIEHPSVLEAAKARAGQLTLIPVDRWGKILLEQVPTDVDLASVMLANNELGTLEPIAELVKRCKKYNILVHTDATQALGKIKIDVKALGVDYLTCAAHKIGGPLGTGIIYIKKSCKLTPLIYGGHQENKLRAGTSNVLAIAGFGEAAKWCWDNWSCKKYQTVAKLRDELRARILAEVPYSSANSPETDCLPHILNMSFAAAEGESIQLYLDVQGVAVSTGSACAAGDIQPSHVLMATRHDAEVAHSSIRFSLGLDTTQQDLEQVMAVLPDVIKRLQNISTVKVGV